MKWLDRQHHQLNGHESEQATGDSEGQGRLACYSPLGQRVDRDLVTEQQQQHICTSFWFGFSNWGFHNGSVGE